MRFGCGSVSSCSAALICVASCSCDELKDLFSGRFLGCVCTAYRTPSRTRFLTQRKFLNSFSFASETFQLYQPTFFQIRTFLWCNSGLMTGSYKFILMHKEPEVRVLIISRLFDESWPLLKLPKFSCLFRAWFQAVFKKRVTWIFQPTDSSLQTSSWIKLFMFHMEFPCELFGDLTFTVALPETNSSHLKMMGVQARNLQTSRKLPPIFRCELFVSGRVYLSESIHHPYEWAMNLGFSMLTIIFGQFFPQPFPQSSRPQYGWFSL